MNKYLRNHKESVTEAIDQLWTFGYLTPENYREICNYTEELESIIDLLTFFIQEDDGDTVKMGAKLQEAKNELKWFNDNVQIYADTRISILEMHFTCDRPFSFIGTGYSNDPFFDFKKLVEQINCYYNIQEPYKPSHKIAYGWKFAMDKSHPRKYLYACIRNYLQKNDVIFKTSDIQKIVGLKNTEDGDE